MFLNPSRITNSDIDVDYSNDDREKVKKFLLKDHLNIDNIHTSEIITFNTIALKGAIRDVCRALFKDDESKNYLDISNTICKNVEHDEARMRDEYKEVFEYVDILNGCIVSCGTHPSGVLVTDFDIGKEYGLCTSSTTKYPVVCIDMHELDGLMCVKLDILGLDNIGVINNTCKMIGIPRLNPDNVDLNDEDVWRDIREDTTAIFQWESESAQTYLKKFMSDKVIRIAKEHDPDFSYIKWFSFGNGLLRPGCAAYRDDVAEGNYYDNGMKELNQFLSKEAGHICMQETIMQFLVKFCGYTEAMSDNVRRGVAKKIGTEKLLPEIEKSFIEYAPKHYDIIESKCKKIIKPFIQTIKDASSYAFSWNHSDAYSCVGYISGYLRYYYPLEFICAALNIFKDDQDKVIKLTRYAVHRGIKIIPIKFRHSLSEYTVDKENGVIYKGIESIKYLNKKIGKELYALKDIEFDSFVDLLNATKKICNSKQMEILIKLDFFSEFGNPNQLLKEMKLFNEYYGAKHISKNKVDGLIPYDIMMSMCEKETEKKYINVDYMSIIKYLASVETMLTPITDKIKYELECLGYIQIVCPELDECYMYVIDVYGAYSKKNVSVYVLKTGEQRLFKVKKSVFENNPIASGDFIDAMDYGEEFCWSKDKDGQWVQSKTNTETILKKYSMVR